MFKHYLEKLIDTAFKTMYYDFFDKAGPLGTTTVPIYLDPYDSEISKLFKIQKDIVEDDNIRDIKCVIDFEELNIYMFPHFASHDKVIKHFNIKDPILGNINYNNDTIILGVGDKYTSSEIKNKLKKIKYFDKFSGFKLEFN